MTRVAGLFLAVAVSVSLVASDEAGAQDAADVGRRLFTKDAAPPCALCHTLKHAGAAGEIGPSLDELKPDRQRVMKAVRNGIGAMPPFTALSDKDVEAIADYVAKFSGAN